MPTPALAELFDDNSSLFAALRARGYVAKEADEEDLLRAIRAIASGDAIFGAGIARRVVDCSASTQAATTQELPQLSAREREVLDHLATGINNTAIAHQLSISERADLRRPRIEITT